MSYLPIFTRKADDEIVKLKRRIAELEKETEEHKAYIKYLMETCEIFSPVNLAIHELEQQAKGLEDYVSEAMEHYFILHLNENITYHNFLSGLNNRAIKLRNQANQLKGGDL